jgi:ribosome-associated translation inhibitor RaiA
MIIQINTDKTIEGDERHEDFFTTLIAEKLDRYKSQITRVEAHLSDLNGKKEGIKDIRCLLEARVEGRQPMVVSEQADTIEKAVFGAIEKMKNSLDTILGRIQNH